MKNPYTDLTTELQALKPQDPSFARRLNELISINELLTTLNTARTLEETLDIMLLTLLGQYGCLRGSVYIKSKQGWRLGIAKGVRKHPVSANQLPLKLPSDLSPVMHHREEAPKSLQALWDEETYDIVVPMRNEDNTVGLIGLGRSMLGDAAKAKESLIALIADFGGVIIGNSLYRDDLERANRQLQRQIFQLNTLYEITGSFARTYDNDAVFQILSNNLMGLFFISRSAVLEFTEGCQLAHHRGLKVSDVDVPANGDVHELTAWPYRVLALDEVACTTVATFMKEHKLQYALPICSEGNYYGLLLLGPRLDRRKLSEPDKNFVLSLAQQSAVALENVILQKEAIEKKRMERELQLAREIQQELLPKNVPVIDGYELAVEMRPYYQVGGDFYDFIPQADGKIVILLADVSGKSLPASMIMSTAQAALRALNSFGGQSPKEVVEELNRHLCTSTQSNKFLTMFYGLLDPETHRLTYINAGHNRPILLRPDQSTELLTKGGMVVGLFPKATYQVGTVDLEPGTDLLIYTDGISEVVDDQNEEYGDDTLIDLLVKLREEPSADAIKERILHTVMTFSSGKMVDDMTLLLIRRRLP